MNLIILTYVHLSALSTLLTGSASAFAPYAFLNKRAIVPQWLTTSRLAASVSPANPALSPEVFFQSRIAEPADVESVPSAAYLLSDKFPDDPFVVQYRSTSLYDDHVESNPVLDLSVLKQIKINASDNLVTVDAGVTVGALAAELSRLSSSSDLKQLFMALPANSQLSVAEAALDERYTKFHKVVEEVHFVSKDGNIRSKQLTDINVQEDIIVNVILSPKLPKSSGIVGRWYTLKTVEPEVPTKLVNDLPNDVKVIVHKHGMFNNIPNVIVFVDGDKDIGMSKDDWNEILVESPQQLWNLQRHLSDEAGFETLNTSGVLDLEKITPTFADILEVFQMRKENLLVWFDNKQIRASFDKRYPPDVDDATLKYFTFDKKHRLIIAPASVKPLMSNRVAKNKPNLTSGTKIEGFNGEIYDITRSKMQEKRWQYATSSYDNMMNPAIIAYPKDVDDVVLAIKYATLPEFTQARKTIANPSGYPYKVIGRGGGHQYCGVSCDTGAFIISMENFNKTESHNVQREGVTGPDGQPHTVTREIHVGTGNRLEKFAKFMNIDPITNEPAKGTNDSFGCTVPHGECPTVGIGGHAQSGGYGHIVRAFGLAIDYVYQFTIVTANGDIRTVNRDSKDQSDKDLYWAVLGGSPGAFGITTDLVFHPIMDKDYPDSTAFSATVHHTPERMKAVLEILEDFINRAKDSDDDAIGEGLDMMVSLSSNIGNRLIDNLNQGKDSFTPNQNIILFELECRDMKDTKTYEQMKKIMKTFKETVDTGFISGFITPINMLLAIKRYPRMDGKKHYKLSELSKNFVRCPPSVTKGGRENRKPYRKLSYGSKDKLKPGWSKAFADLLNDVEATKDDISCVFQVVAGGGAQTRHGKANLNAIAHRDAQLQSLVFDLFRGDDDDSMKAAAAFGNRFETHVVNKHQTAHPKVMAQWASHGDLEMNKKEVWEKYFDNPETYHRLRRIKKDVDPDDVFHSRFSIRPAED